MQNSILLRYLLDKDGEKFRNKTYNYYYYYYYEMIEIYVTEIINDFKI